MASKPVELSIKDGPVTIPDLEGRGAENQLDLWNGISGQEQFSPTTGSAFYQLSLRKNADDAREVPEIERELRGALRQLSHVWVFAGGTLLRLEANHHISSPYYISNASDVEDEFFRVKGLKRISSSFSYSWAIVGAYRCMPLKIAVQLSRAAMADLPLRRIVEYHYLGMTESEIWFVHLSNLRDGLSKIFGCDKLAQSALGISYSDWGKLGRLVNPGLRHPDMTTETNEITPEEISFVRRMVTEWVFRYLACKELPTAQVQTYG